MDTPADAVTVLEIGGVDAGLPTAYAGWLLARLGARVLRLDPPDDAPALARAPRPGSPLRLALDALALGKSVEPMPADAAALDARLAGADVLLCDPARLPAALGASPAGLLARRPALVVGAASVFGLHGPYAGLPGVALDAQALSGASWALGEPGRAPLSLPAGIVEHQSGAMLAAGCLLALAVRDDTGVGRVVDVALADVLASHVAGNCRFYVHHGLRWHRSGRRASDSGGAYPFVILPCADGLVCLTGRTRDEWRRLVRAMGSPAWASEPRYTSLRRMGRQYPEEVDALVAPWFASRTTAELERIALESNLIVSPLRELPEVLATPHFVDGGFFEPVRIDGRAMRAPGLPASVRETRAPDAPDIAATLLHGRSAPATPATPAAKATAIATANATATATARDEVAGDAAPGPLAGLRVLDLGWVWSAPWVGTMLGELGAEVIKVEHSKRPDNLRLSGDVYRDGVKVEGPSTEISPMYHQVNHGKLGVTLNAKDPRGVDLIRRLAAISDVVVENMSPGAVDRQGIGWDALSAVNPRLVMLSMSSAGQFGALSSMRAYAPTMSSFAGMEGLVGYPDEPPLGALNFALGDPNGSVHALGVLLAALRRARATGRGAHVDLSQLEALAGTLRPWLLDAQRRGGQPPCIGNAHPDMAPHGVYPAAGDDAWLTLAVTDDAAWRALCALAPDEPWAVDATLAGREARLARRASLDDAIARWTATQPRDALVARLRAAGVASSPVLSIEEVRRDPHFAARRLHAPVELPFYGPEALFRAPWSFSDFEPRIGRAGPRLGEHNEQVLGGLLGLPADEIARLVAEGVIA